MNDPIEMTPAPTNRPIEEQIAAFCQIFSASITVRDELNEIAQFSVTVSFEPDGGPRYTRIFVLSPVDKADPRAWAFALTRVAEEYAAQVDRGLRPRIEGTLFA